MIITWFGGEPLLQFNIVEKPTEKIKSYCMERQITYSASMITNGYLLSEDLTKKLPGLSITHVQVTLDGPAYIHNLRRKHKDQKSLTFDKCISAITLLTKYNIQTDISIAKVTEFTQACHDVENCYFSQCEYEDCLQKINNEIVELKLYQIIEVFYPQLKCNYCGADQVTSYTIGSNGQIYKCWCDVGNDKFVIGNIADFDVNDDINEVEAKYLDYSAFRDTECCNCKLLPLCMGGCPRKAIMHHKICSVNVEILKKC